MGDHNRGYGRDYPDRRGRSNFDSSYGPSRNFRSSAGGRDFSSSDGGYRGGRDYGRGGGRGYSGGEGFRGGRGGGGFRGGRGGGNQITREMQNLQIVDNNELLPGNPAFRSEIPPKGNPDLKANYYELDIRRAVDVYQYDLMMHGIKGGIRDRPEKKIELWRQDKNDIAKNQKYHALHELFNILLDENKTFFQINTENKPLYVYDRSRTVYSTICLMEDLEERTFCLTLNNLNEHQTLYLRGYSRVEVTLKRTAYLKDIGKLDFEDVASSRPVMAYLDVLLFQQAYATNMYFVFGPKLYLKDETNPKVLQSLRGCYNIKSGMTKGCSVLKAVDEFTKRMERKVYLQIDCKLAAFYKPMPLIEFIWNKFGDPYRASIKEISNAIKGIVVTTIHRREKNSTFVIHGLSEEGANRLDIVLHPNNRNPSGECLI